MFGVLANKESAICEVHHPPTAGKARKGGEGREKEMLQNSATTYCFAKSSEKQIAKQEVA